MRTAIALLILLVVFRIVTRYAAQRQREKRQQELERLRRTPVLHLND